MAVKVTRPSDLVNRQVVRQTRNTDKFPVIITRTIPAHRTITREELIRRAIYR